MFHLIESKEDLNFLSGELSERGCLAIDTEFKRTSKDNLQLSLIQISDSEEIYIIDCIKIGQLEMNLSFLSSKEVEKVFHSCREDVEAIFSWTDEKLNNIFDTQLANAFLGGSFSISYQDIVGFKSNKTLIHIEQKDRLIHNNSFEIKIFKILLTIR